MSQGIGMIGVVDVGDRSQDGAGNSVRFAAAARRLGQVARAQGLLAPSFRSPPRLPAEGRTIRRWPRGGATVAVSLRNRPWPAVLADMVEGVVVANGLDGREADRARTALWAAVTGDRSGSVAA